MRLLDSIAHVFGRKAPPPVDPIVAKLLEFLDDGAPEGDDGAPTMHPAPPADPIAAAHEIVARGRARFAVRYKTEVIQPTTVLGVRVPFTKGKVVASRDWHRNLVLDVGMDMPAAYPIADCFHYLALGTSTNPTKRDSGTVQASKTGATITANAIFFAPADVGRLFKFDTGQEFKITGYTSNTVVTVADAATNVPSAEFTIWYTNDTNHGAEFYRGATVDATAGNNKSTFLVDTWTHQRVFLTSTFALAKQVTEIGWSPNSGAGQNLFGRDLIPAGGDYVAAGQQYKVTVQLAVTYAPATAAAQADVGSGGWNTTGTFGWEWCQPCQVQADGSTEAVDGQFNTMTRLEFCPTAPGGASPGFTLQCTDLATAIRAMSPTTQTTGANIGTAVPQFALVGAAYVSGSWQRDYTQTVGTAYANGNVRSILFKAVGYSNGAAGFVRVLLANAQTKDALHKITFAARFSWSRLLVN